jgi:biotin operon repressor
MTVAKQVEKIMKSHRWLTLPEIGNKLDVIALHTSIYQRVNQLKLKGYTIVNRVRKGTKRLYEYKMIQEKRNEKIS